LAVNTPISEYILQFRFFGLLDFSFSNEKNLLHFQFRERRPFNNAAQKAKSSCRKLGFVSFLSFFRIPLKNRCEKGKSSFRVWQLIVETVQL